MFDDVGVITSVWGVYKAVVDYFTVKFIGHIFIHETCTNGTKLKILT